MVSTAKSWPRSARPKAGTRGMRRRVGTTHAKRRAASATSTEAAPAERLAGLVPSGRALSNGRESISFSLRERSVGRMRRHGHALVTVRVALARCCSLAPGTAVWASWAAWRWGQAAARPSAGSRSACQPICRSLRADDVGRAGLGVDPHRLTDRLASPAGRCRTAGRPGRAAPLDRWRRPGRSWNRR